MTSPTPAPGWYSDPSDPGKKLYWDGSAWMAPPLPPQADKPDVSRQLGVTIGVCVLVGIGLVMSMQSASLLTGTGSIWTGVGLVGAGTAVAFFLRAATWVRVVAALCLAAALFNAFYMEKQIDDKRNEIGQMFNNQ